jgi:hypothetical protein
MLSARIYRSEFIISGRLLSCGSADLSPGSALFAPARWLSYRAVEMRLNDISKRDWAGSIVEMVSSQRCEMLHFLGKKGVL